MNRSLLYIFLLLIIAQCSQKEREGERIDTLFHFLDSSQTHVDFVNQLNPTEDFNMYLFRNFYNGGGVAVGDVSGDGLPDIFLTGNMTSNRLYLNQGDFVFEDITNSAGLDSEGYWSTGAGMADVNGDGWLDIYVTLSGKPGGEKRHNRLYINNADSVNVSFTESALEYNLEDDGLSTHGVFFDYNLDGLLDLYLISNSFHEVGGFEGVTGTDREVPDPRGASKLYRNDGGSFTDVTQEAGIYSSVIGFGMSASVGDVNRDGFPDLYAANDFFERDYLYINNGDGTFTESLEDRIRSLSFSSMGSDIADINNDGWPEIYVTDMLPNDETRLKSKMTIESWEEYQENVAKGFHHKFTRNTLQLNRGDAHFSEVGRYSGVHATDWSWAALMADFDNNGLNDIFVANGIYKDLLDQDYIAEMSDPRFMKQLVQSGEENVILNMMDQMSSAPQSNFAFRNENGLKFTDQTELWGLDQPGFSTGAAWGDLDDDGDLDLVINEVNGPARIYRNRSNEIYPDRTWLNIELEGERPNTFGIGAQLHIWSGKKYWFREHYLQRGFQSSMEPGLHIGFGEISRIDSLAVRWPDGRVSRRQNLELPAKITISQNDSKEEILTPPQFASIPGDINAEILNLQSPILRESEVKNISEWNHQSYNYNDFDRERLLTHRHSTEGPALCTGDINGDSMEDVYIGGAREQPGVLWIQNRFGAFTSHQPELFQNDAISEDTDCAFFDAAGNGVDDLYVVSGGNSFSSMSSALADRLYLNDGAGSLTKSSQILPTTRGFDPGSVVVSNDFNNDGNIDLFVGTRLKPFAIGVPVNGYLLAGNGTGEFSDVTEAWAPGLLESGMITDALWADLTGDGISELVITGEWMPIRVFENQGDRFEEITGQLGLSESKGWWNSLTAGDIDGDGRTDLVAGNHGYNSIFEASEEYPIKMFVGDISRNGMTEQIVATPKDGEYYPVALRHEMAEVIPAIGERFPDYSSYAATSIGQLFTDEELARTISLQASHLGSAVIWNRPDGMVIEALPPRAQLSPMYGAELKDLDGDESPEIILGGNLYDVKPLAGPYDASRGVVVSFKEDKLYTWPNEISSLNITGEIRGISSLKIGDEPYLIVARHDSYPVILQLLQDNK